MNRTRTALTWLPVVFSSGNGNMSTAITTFRTSDMVLPIPNCIDLMVNQERHLVIASQECFVV
jgi:hypothetical protein